MIKEFYFLTIFPDLIDFYLKKSIPFLAQKKEKAAINIVNIRKEKHHQVDDYAYGGDSGMVLMIEPIVERLKEHELLKEHIILVSPRGKQLTQAICQRLSKINKKIVFICGHYEGVDERISTYVSEEISIGDYVLSSGELAALVIVDSVIRLIPGVINPQSLVSESFSDNLLDFPAYSRPFDFKGNCVPDVLVSGNHKDIAEYRLKERIRITKLFRPDLFKKYLEEKK